MGTSYQKGWVEIRGKKWYGYYRRTVLDPETNAPKTIKTPVILGLKSQLTKSEAREKLAQEITRMSGQISEDGSVKNGAVTFGWFVRNRYLPLKEADWREETAKIKKHIITADLIVPFEDVRLEKFDRYILQSHLNELAKTRSKDRVLQIRAYMRDIFVEAVDQDFLDKDPARKAKVPANLREVDNTTLTWEQLRAALEKLGEISLRDWILMKLDMSNALRPSELFAVRWCRFLDETNILDMKETVYKGKVRSFGKTRRSMSPVPVADQLATEILEYREECIREDIDVSPDAFMFPDTHGGPMDSGNYRRRVLHKIARQLGLPKLTFQVIRRTIATLGKTKGHVKDIQGLMRHTKASTTTDVYMQSLEHEVRTAVNSICDELPHRGNSGTQHSKAAAPKPTPEGTGRSTASETMEQVEVESALSHGDDIILRGLGVKWESDPEGNDDAA